MVVVGGCKYCARGEEAVPVSLDATRLLFGFNFLIYVYTYFVSRDAKSLHVGGRSVYSGVFICPNINLAKQKRTGPIA